LEKRVQETADDDESRDRCKPRRGIAKVNAESIDAEPVAFPAGNEAADAGTTA
jgi:hypothetical protein